MADNDLISRSELLDDLRGCYDDLIRVYDSLRYIPEKQICGAQISELKTIVYWVNNAPAVDAVEVTAQELQFLIDAMYRHIRWMIAGRLDKPECSYDERVALLERLTLFEREHFPDMQAETEG